ncbi:hypothetical protein F4553_002153 [Allocatelliglobosispora scoriae]|uniref:Uncharacterized protein n=1 Tax=Allocatelliglobosispora scoriae TaxID=643052 RepID=A0A841BKH2_9ACTN|nr:hypothetical protein [Allocatelliglobosispora scoriae]MBB5868774.1 hypothetical protein [Allocatelliglobosispora scoriae]
MTDSAPSQELPDLSQLGQLVLATTSAWLLTRRDVQLLGIRYPPQRDEATAADNTNDLDDPTDAGDTDQDRAVKYGALLHRVLDDSPGRAWLRRGSAPDGTGRADGEATGTGHRYRSGPADSLIAQLEAELLTAQLSAPVGTETDTSLMSLRHQLFIDADRFAAITGMAPPAVGFWVMIDLRFSALFDQLRCQATVSVWSSPPRSVLMRPNGVEPSDQPITGRATVYRDAFIAIAAEAEALLARHLFGVHMDVFEREYTLPVFWVAAPTAPPADPMGYLALREKGGPGAWIEWTSERTEELLGVADARDHALTRSVLNGNLLILRRVCTEPGADGRSASSRSVPKYLLLAGGPDMLLNGSTAFPAEENGGNGLAMRRARVELGTAKVINELTDLEAQAGNLLHLRQRDLEIWGNHLRVYNAVVERGAFLWDALSTHLMIRWGAPFERAHSAVDMLHQVLQQAVADLRHIATLSHQAQAGIGAAADSLQESYDQRIGERTIDQEPGLRAALTETGLFGRVSKLGDETVYRAERVKTSYDDLLKAIAGAFDERRVRELDGTQKASLLVGIFAAMIGIVTVLDATINMKREDMITIFGGWRWLDEFGVVFSSLIGVAVLILCVYLYLWVQGIGKLGSARFRRIYHGPQRRGVGATSGLWRFLKNSSTDYQKRLRKTPKKDWDRVWTEHDLDCATELATIWDDGLTLPECDRDDDYRKDIKGLSHLIEQWGIHSLLLTERARVMHWFDLPNLTCLYRCCTRIEESFLDLSDLGDAPSPPLSMVADIDITLALMRLGFSRSEAHGIDDWLTVASFPSARAALERVRLLELRVGMSPAERLRTMRVVRPD